MSAASSLVCLSPRLLAAGRSLRLQRGPGAACASRLRVFASAAAPGGPIKHHLLYYSYVKDILEKRGPYRAEHIEGAKKQVASSKMLMAGAHDSPVDGAVFVWGPTATKEEIEAFVKADPYVKNGLVTSWSIREWNVVASASK